MSMQNQPDSPALEELAREAEALEDRAEADGLIPDDDAEEDGVGPQTGIVP